MSSCPTCGAGRAAWDGGQVWIVTLDYPGALGSVMVTVMVIAADAEEAFDEAKKASMRTMPVVHPPSLLRADKWNQCPLIMAENIRG